jgi:hypothetical protein
MQIIQINSRIKICLNKDGTLDEIFVFDESGQCMIHLEQLDDRPTSSTWYGGFYSTKTQPMINDLKIWIGNKGICEIESNRNCHDPKLFEILGECLFADNERLTPGKVYPIMGFENNLVRLIDNSGDDHLYPSDYFSFDYKGVNREDSSS